MRALPLAACTKRRWPLKRSFLIWAECVGCLGLLAQNVGGHYKGHFLVWSKCMYCPWLLAQNIGGPYKGHFWSKLSVSAALLSLSFSHFISLSLSLSLSLSDMFCSILWGTERRVSCAQTWEQGPPSAWTEYFSSFSLSSETPMFFSYFISLSYVEMSFHVEFHPPG